MNFQKFSKLLQIGPYRHYSSESTGSQKDPSLFSNSSVKSLTWIYSRGCSGAHRFGRQGRRRWRAARPRQALAYVHSHRALAWPALAWEGPATCMGGMLRRRPAMAVARRRVSGIVLHERGLGMGRPRAAALAAASFARWRVQEGV